MKTGKMMKCIVAMMLLCMSAMPVMAQKNIDKVVKELENRSDVSIHSVVKRDPKTRKIITMTKVYSVKDDRMAGELRNAFEKDEEFAITSTINMQGGRNNLRGMNLFFVFNPTENEKHTYSLTCNRDGEMTLTIIIKQEKDGRDVSWWDADIIRNNPEIRRQLRRFTARQQKALQGDELGCVVTGK